MNSFSNTVALQNGNNNKRREIVEEEEAYDQEQPAINTNEEETPVRQVLFRFHMLSEMNNSHMLEKYTFLPEYSTTIATVFDNALLKVFSPPKNKKMEEKVYREAYARCMASCAENTIPACRPCNLAMTKVSPQMLVAIRCGAHTKDLAWSSLMKHRNGNELLQQEADDVVAKDKPTLTRLRKTLQQIALYFDFDGQNWVPKPTRNLLMDAYLWRCVVQLGVWCAKEDEFRARACAVMYLAFLVFYSTPWAQRFEFIDWHIHVFRRFYMSTYAENTFAGYPCVQLKALFSDTWEDAQRWCKFVQATQAEVASRLLQQATTVRNPMEVQELNTLLLQEVSDEQTLLVFLRRQTRSEKAATKQFFHYMEYNVRSSHTKLLRLLTGARAALEVALRPKKGLAIAHRRYG